jgi:D-glycero-D-manno-heptose 1,7-bisphosphate phosphatase
MGETAADARDLSPAAFLDRDGTIVHDRHYLADPDGLELLAGAGAALRRLSELGFLLVVVSNQSGVGRGLFTLDDVERMNARLRDLLAREGVVLAGIYVCPHHPDDGCRCRKPEPGLIETAAAELGIDLGRSIMIGDRDSDVAAGAAAGLTAMRVGDGGDAPTLAAAVATIGASGA